MINQIVDIKLVPLNIEKIAKFKSIRLVSENRHIHIATLTDGEKIFENLISLSQMDDGKVIRQSPRMLFKIDSFVGVSSWDISNGQAGLTAVWSYPQSATVNLVYRRLGGEDINLTAGYSSPVFQGPRFLRGTNSLAITANASREKVIALFHDDLESDHAPFVPLPSPAHVMLEDGLLLQQGSGYLFFTTHLFAGPRGPARKDLNGSDISPSILRCIRLNAKFQQVGTTMSPIGDTDVFEFDADIVGDKVFLFATTTDGYMAAVATGSNEGLQWATTEDIISDYDLFSPSVLASGKTAMAAVIESDKVDHTQLLIGHFKY